VPFVLTALVGTGVALLRGGSVSNLDRLSIRWPGLPLLALAIQVYVIYGPGRKDSEPFGFTALLLLASYGLLMVAVVANWRLPGMVWLGAGAALNLLVIFGNGGWMPVTAESLVRVGFIDAPSAIPLGQRLSATKDVVMASQEIRLRWLSDQFVIPRAGIFSAVFSAGDALMMLGLFLLIQAGMVRGSEQAG
jgi:hypothetical protein